MWFVKLAVPLPLLSTPNFIGLGAWKSKPKWAVSGVALIFLALILIKQ